MEEALAQAERVDVELHLRSCQQCTELLTGMKEILHWGKSFPVHDAPAWLPARILANTPRIARETWLDTLSGIVRWIIEPRTAMMIFTATLVLSWMGSLAGISLSGVAATVRDPATIYYEAGTLANRAYAGAVRKYYSAPLVTQIQSQIERLREIS